MVFCSLLSVAVAPAVAGEWGIGSSWRISSIPYETGSADDIYTVVPQILYEGENVFVRQSEAGIKLYENDDNRVNAIVQRRFVNIPKDMQNEYQVDSIDYGFQWTHRINDSRNWRVELLTEDDSNAHAYAGHDWRFQLGQLELETTVGARYKSSQFNSYYYGLSDFPEFNGEELGAGIDGEFGLDFRYPLIGGLYLTGGLEYTYLDSEARSSHAIDQNGFGTVTMGFAYFENSSVSGTPAFAEGSYLRVAHGWATPTDIDGIIKLKAEEDEYNNQLSSVFYGHPLSMGWLDTNIDVYLHSGLVYHHSSSVQEQAVEGVFAIKAYLNFEWPVRWRFGMAEGLSYVSRLTYIEDAEMNKQETNGSKLMNYLDVSLDANVGDIFNEPALESMWAGWSIHHRSGIFKQSSQFGRIDGGSNYNTVYLQWHY